MTGGRVRAAGACLLLSGVLNTVGDFLSPVHSARAGQHLEAIAAHPGAHLASVVLWLAAMALAVPGVVTLGVAAGGRAVPIARYSRGMALTGLGALTVLTAYELKLAALVARSGAADPTGVEAVAGSGSYIALFVIAQGWLLGLAGLALALRRQGSLHPAAVAVLLAGAAAALLAVTMASRSAYLAASVLLAGGLGAVGALMALERIRPPARRG